MINLMCLSGEIYVSIYIYIFGESVEDIIGLYFWLLYLFLGE